jgi:hypothetical protein
MMVNKMGLKSETILSIGMISMAVGILVGQFTGFEIGGFSASAFAEGVLMGVALVLNLFYLATRRRT